VPPKGGPIRAHGTETSTRSWSGPRAEARLGQAPTPVLRQAYAWVDPDGDPEVKSSYKFIHHHVPKEGKVGAANVRACRTGIGVLNGGRGGANIPDSDRKGVWNHLARHLRDAGEDPPELK
jgi:Escherichia/Staphylococcus phage prohead protease